MALSQGRDNFSVESPFATRMREPAHDERYATQELVKASIFEYVVAFYNRVRRHSPWGYFAQAECERPHNSRQPLTPAPFFLGKTNRYKAMNHSGYSRTILSFECPTIYSFCCEVTIELP
ncbi:transposase [Limnoglobus roseus]|uniref:Transposase n=1 Tax=Limnoglobus roseus TaxID=2598579 RepID=A0A5C1AMU2_9BACT|nr:transposase [Limnoglobus roseus]